jgi:cell fate regulator YaaT (PSP1 superfamily)
MEKKVSVQIRKVGGVNSFLCGDLDIKTGDYVIVEAERGLDYGQAVSDSEEIKKNAPKPRRKINRIMNLEDLQIVKLNLKQTEKALKTCKEKIFEHKLEMKLIDAEFSFDKSKIIFYFTAGERVDFRELVKDLAKIFKTRIEMKQIGVRDETKLFGGIGPCGKKLCCTKFLTNFQPVTIKMAKLQNLPLNPTKISGICGRLLCCLSYEYKTYKDLSKKLPKEGKTINTPEGKAKIVEVNPLKQQAILEFENGERKKINYEEK